jgi:acetoin:2,6-dichlorophenolindophenol oxidoreductase subunit alpha
MMDDRQLVDALRAMLRIRLFEDRVRREFGKGDMPGFVHTYVGAEAVAVGVCAHLGDRDLITSTHRGHGHCLAKGVPIGPMVAELYGRETGLCRGRGGSMHVADFSRGMLGANAIVGGGISLAVGGALAAQTLGDGRVAVTFFGDGASNQGIFHESLNLAAIWRLPVVFVCENNGWAESTPAAYSTSVDDISTRAAGYGIPGVQVDAADAEAVWEAAGAAIERARRGEGPTLLEARIRRLGGHYVGDPEGYRSRDDRREARSGDPIVRLRDRLEAAGVDIAAIVQDVEASVVADLDAAFDEARQAPFPDPAEIDRYVLAG